jgi:predicted nucleic-acid-binding protein
MRAVDTNVLIRLLTQDEPAQAARAAALLKREEIWIAKTVVLETVWVLRSLYDFEQARIVQALRALAGLERVYLEDPSAVAFAFELADSGLDLADALHVSSMGEAKSFVTFDEKLVVRARKLAPVSAL